MNVLLGRPAAAFTNLTFLLDQYILPNTFYHEGENGECGETPPAASNHPLYPPRMLRPLYPILLFWNVARDSIGCFFFPRHLVWMSVPVPSRVDVGVGAGALLCRCWYRVPGAKCRVPFYR